MSTQITTGKVRFSYCNLFTPRAVQEGATPKYSVTLLIPKSDKATMQKIKAAMDEATASILAFMDSKKNDVCGLIDKLLAAMGDEDKLAAATVNQLATAMGIVIDKYTANEAIKSSDAKETNFFEAIRAAGKEVDLSAIPELQSSAERDPLLVDETGTPE